MERLTVKRKDGRWALAGEGIGAEHMMKIPVAIDRLAAYEDAEEQGRLVWLPCKVGGTVWKLETGIHPYATKQIATEHNIFDWMRHGEFGKTVFLTREAAEAALKEREG